MLQINQVNRNNEEENIQLTIKQHLATYVVAILNKVLLTKANSVSSTWYYESKRPANLQHFKKHF